MRGELSLRIDDGQTDIHVTNRTTGLRFKRSAFGGDIDLTCKVRLPRGTFGDLGPGDAVTLYDRASGDVVWSGHADNPGGTAGPAGESYDLQALGGATRLQAAKEPLGYVLASNDDWTRSGGFSTKGAQTSADEKRDGTPTLEINANEDKRVTPSWQGQWANRALKNAGLLVGRVTAAVDAGRTDSDYLIQLMSGPDLDSLINGESFGANTTERVLNAALGSANPIHGQASVVALRVQRRDTNRTATDDDWFRFSGMVVRQRLKDKTGTDKTDLSNYTTNTVTSTQVIEDMVGRGMCPGLDPAKVTIGTFSYAIDALDWLDGITMGDALAELLVFERNLHWQVYGDTATFDTWNHNLPRYAISRKHGGITLPGQEITLCNRILVSWTDRKARDRTTVVRADVPGLTYTRDADPITLPAGSGTPANAQRAGTEALAITNNPPRAGAAVIRQPIYDAWQGCMVRPHEVMPGCVVLDQQTGEEFRLTETDYSDDAGAVVCTLGDPVRSVEQVMARLQRKQRRRRRK